MEIKVEIKSVYGTERIYPACENGRKYLEVFGKKTFCLGEINALKALGIKFFRVRTGGYI